MLSTVSIIISGEVQGVFFRKYTVEAAQKFGITGYVKNLPDQNVMVEATGETEALKKFVEWCHMGSPMSSVTEVKMTQIEYTKFNGFQIR